MKWIILGGNDDKNNLVQECLKRIKFRKRDSENKITAGYLNSLFESYNELIIDIDTNNVLKTSVFTNENDLLELITAFIKI
jgi:deoxyadenosine/deoxycytidine kinase